MIKTYEIRDPIHGFIVINDWEREIINHPVFQRLRRIRQLAWTDMVYPGAMHTRFEHSLGVMHVATEMFKQVARRRQSFLVSELGYTPSGLDRDLVLVRLASLLHDVGHAPFSHAGEGLMPINSETDRPYKHEYYSAAAITHLLADIIENHQLNQNYGIKARDIADFLNGRASVGRALLWRGLVSSQLDADRADYLLRDSHHIGVAYGRYDLQRLLFTITVANDRETDSPTLAVEEGGMHAAEGLILARYMMFTQVYFQHTRRAYDYHIAGAVKTLLPETRFPPPTSVASLNEYLAWNDWRILGLIDAGGGGNEGRILRARNHHRRVYETPETPQQTHIQLFQEVLEKMGQDVALVDRAESSWYKFEKDDIPILRRSTGGKESLKPLSSLSSVVHGLKAVNQMRIYASHSDKERARKCVDTILRERGGLS
jgi:HD superfamily phosphohydrolase